MEVPQLIQQVALGNKSVVDVAQWLVDQRLNDPSCCEIILNAYQVQADDIGRRSLADLSNKLGCQNLEMTNPMPQPMMAAPEMTPGPDSAEPNSVEIE